MFYNFTVNMHMAPYSDNTELMQETKYISSRQKHLVNAELCGLFLNLVRCPKAAFDGFILP